MDNQMNNQNPMQQPMQNMPMPQKKGHGGLVTVIVLILVILAVFFFWPKKSDDTDLNSTTAQDSQSEDLNSIEADLEATTFEGVSEGL